jgi:flavin-dependent dehydrogenase
MADDVLIVGAGPAGSIAALVLARAGARVGLVDRAQFPRDKLCGDSINPGAMGLLARHDLARRVEACGLPMIGMLVTGPGGAAVEGWYPTGVIGRSLMRRHLDRLLLEAAIAAGARFEAGLRVTGPLVEEAGGPVLGVRVDGAPGTPERRAAVVIAADGRRSTLAFGLGLARHPRRPRRWALGAYYEGVSGLGSRGEMHVRRHGYLGVAPVPGGLANVCLVLPEVRARSAVRAAEVSVDAALAADDRLRERFQGARRVTPVSVLGPLAVDAVAAGVPGLLLAGDAAGFIDPMTGDGLRLAMRGGELAAEVALEVLAGLDAGSAPSRLAGRRQAEFAGKRRVNRALRALVGMPAGVSCAALGGRLLPSLVGRLIEYSGDVGYAGPAA